MYVGLEEVDWRGSSYEDIRRLIRSEVAKACYLFGIEISQHGDDVEQECWSVVLRKLPQYREMGYKVTTYLFMYIRRDARAACYRIRRHGGIAVPTEQDLLEEREMPGGEDPPRELDWELADDLLYLHAAGYSDEEIREMTGEQNPARRRSRSRRELLDAVEG